MQCNRLIVLVVATVLGASSSAHGLERLIELPETSDEQRRVERQKYLDELIGSIGSECDLTERQLRRLQVASKGAVEYSFSDQLNANENRSGRPNPGQLEIWGGKLHVVTSLDAAAAVKHPIWTRTLERTLTSQQLEKAHALAKQQLEKWTERFAPQRIFLRGGKVAAPIRARVLLKPIAGEVQPIEIEHFRRLDLIADPPRSR